MKRDVIDAFISTKPGCICIHTVPSDEGSMVTVRCGGGVGDDSGVMASVADHRGVEKAIRTSLVPTEMDALQAPCCEHIGRHFGQRRSSNRNR